MIAQAFAPSSHSLNEDNWRKGHRRERVLKVAFWSDDLDSEEDVESPESAVVPRWLHDVEQSVNGVVATLSSLGRPVHYDVIISCFGLLGRIMDVDTIAPAVVPRFDGGLQLEWHSNGVDLEICLEPDGSRSAWCEHSSGREWDDEGNPLNIGRLRKELSLLTHDG